MGNTRRRRILMRSSALAGALSLAVAGGAYAADQRIVAFDLPEQSLGESLRDFYRASGEQIVFSESIVAGRRAPGLKGDYTPDQALALLLDGTNLTARRSATGVVMIEAPQPDSAAGDGAEAGTVEALIVTAQKREEDIQDVPIAISAFTQEQLERSQVAGGPDLMTQVPNMTFTKTNFSSYSIQIRGIGTQAISATTDPAVAVAFNNTPFVRNRFFEQEFYDLQRVEVLRGPQGTLYGRNATAGVVNMISAKPTYRYEAKLSGDLANYGSTRLEGMVNIPLVEGKAALRLAGAWTKRDGYVSNSLTGDQTDGRDLWSGRLTLGFEPTDRLRAYVIYEHFEEDDDRLRSGKQLCKRNPNPTRFGNYVLPVEEEEPGIFSLSTYTSQGCEPASLYADESFDTPNGWALPYYAPLSNASFPAALGGNVYVNATQSRDLHSIETSITPVYKAKTDIVELQVNFDLTPSLSLASETAYSSDELFSFSDFNRFNTAPGAFGTDIGWGPEMVQTGRLDENGVFCDPQLGCSDRLVAADLSTARSSQFSQELRLSSNFDGDFNFSLGANFLRYDTVDKYYVFFNSLSLWTTVNTFPPSFGRTEDHYYVPGVYDGSWCMDDLVTSQPSGSFGALPLGCMYMDPNPIGNLNDFGRQYFLSKNPYKLISYALFGEAQYQVSESLKLTAGLRWTVDKKEAPIVPSWLLALDSYGLPVLDVVEQEWREPTGRLLVDWKPDLGFTDETLVYLSYSHGYKAGGANPPLPVNTFDDFGGNVHAAILASHPPTFEPEFIEAYEAGVKNVLLDGTLTLNANTFYYDYTGYQISQIVDRSALNMNFDAEVWGAELEVDWRPVENLRLGFKGGYEKTRLADGSSAIDTIDRTAGDPNYVIARPFPTVPSNCIVPVWWAEYFGFQELLKFRLGQVCQGYYGNDDPITGLPYVPFPTESVASPIPPGYPGLDPASLPNGGLGVSKDLSGNELPNAPDYTATITADYTIPLQSDWLMTLHTDLYYQSEAWTRIFNTEGYDKLKAYTNVNLAAIFTNEDAGWKVMAYVKNVFDRDSITGAFLNSDDTGLTTNVFLTEPRLYGLRVTKTWSGGSMSETRLGDLLGGQLNIEVAGAVERTDAPNNATIPAFFGEFPDGFEVLSRQDGDLDWGDGRELKLSYQRRGSPWLVSGKVRYGRANGHHRTEMEQQQPGGTLIFNGREFYFPGPYDWGTSDIHNREEHLLLDFSVGREFGLGALADRSSFSVGVRYADFSSRTEVEAHGVPDYLFPEGNLRFYEISRTWYDSELLSERGFEGVGPHLTWDAARTLIGDDETGRLALDVGFSGGVLFGKQDVRRSEFTKGRYAHGIARLKYEEILDPLFSEQTRRESVTVPNLAVELGLSYSLDTIRVSAGYRAERFYDVLDGGSDERRKVDRTIDGPYFKFSIGLGR